MRHTALRLVPMAVTASTRSVSSSGTEVAEMAKAIAASIPPTIVAETSSPGRTW
jgi:hypothetical protein